MREEESDCPGESQIDIDLSIVKEEELSIDDFNEFPWPENTNQDDVPWPETSNQDYVNVKKEEDEEEPETGEDLQNFELPKRKTTRKQRRKQRRGPTKVSKTRKVKHWCSICNCKQESPHALALHRIKYHPNDAQFSCAYCPRVFFHHSNRRKHELIFHLGPRERHQCTMCNKTFARKEGLQAHIRVAHTGERPYTCQHCGMSFARHFCYRTHLYTHSEITPYECEQCNRTFNSKSDLVRHRRLHTGEKPYSCDRCQKTFRVRGQLNHHKAVHSGERPLACGLCSKTFRLGTNIALHREGHIADATMTKTHKCDVCQRVFTRKGNLKEHKKRHAPVKRAKCKYCCLAFRTKGDLAKHVNVHTREKLYVCDTCGKNFLRKGILRRHIHTFHLSPQLPKRPTICVACGRDYFFPSRLKIHQKNKKCTEYLRQLKIKEKSS